MSDADPKRRDGRRTTDAHALLAPAARAMRAIFLLGRPARTQESSTSTHASLPRMLRTGSELRLTPKCRDHRRLRLNEGAADVVIADEAHRAAGCSLRPHTHGCARPSRVSARSHRHRCVFPASTQPRLVRTSLTLCRRRSCRDAQVPCSTRNAPTAPAQTGPSERIPPALMMREFAWLDVAHGRANQVHGVVSSRRPIGSPSYPRASGRKPMRIAHRKSCDRSSAP